MGAKEADAMLATGRERYLRLLQEATALLRSLDTYSPLAIREAVQRRQKLVESLQDFDVRLEETLAGTDLSEFRSFQAEITRKILEVDGLVVGLALGKRDAAKRKLAALSKSHSAFQAYEKREAVRRPGVNSTV
jgi:hypothetical protein